MSRYISVVVMEGLRDHLRSYAPLVSLLSGRGIYLGWNDDENVNPPYIVIRNVEEVFSYQIGTGKMSDLVVTFNAVDANPSPDEMGGIVDTLCDAFEYNVPALSRGSVVGDIMVESVRTYPDDALGMWISEIRATVTVEGI